MFGGRKKINAHKHQRKARAKKAKCVIVYEKAPQRNRAGYFITSFFLTLFFLSCLGGLAAAYLNSRKVAFDAQREVFAVSGTSTTVDIDVLGKNFSISGVDKIEKQAQSVVSAVRTGISEFAGDIEPGWVELVRMAVYATAPERAKIIKHICESIDLICYNK